MTYVTSIHIFISEVLVHSVDWKKRNRSVWMRHAGKIDAGKVAGNLSMSIQLANTDLGGVI